ncbi:hypothetical protein BES08_11930 [Novosphingobium resinovorum]|uniref:Uncharacterized protein n=2 Tax=Novosphingobium resinovorum TaxID=158500 RepID=A0A1D8A5L4_9SPHN|nr:hypothetical protein BES08_11930 [Novosphingobium resinovorum]
MAISPIAASAGTSAAKSIPVFTGKAQYASPPVAKSNKAAGSVVLPILAIGALGLGIWAIADKGNDCASAGTDC